jgi:hypothetical protein
MRNLTISVQLGTDETRTLLYVAQLLQDLADELCNRSTNSHIDQVTFYESGSIKENDKIIGQWSILGNPLL